MPIHPWKMENNPQLFAFILGAGIGLLVSVVMCFRRDRLKCQWCGNRHPKRHPEMTTQEFMKFYCGGFRAMANMKEAEIHGSE